MPLQLALPTKEPAPAPILELVGRIDVPAAVADHRFMLEARAVAMLHDASDREESHRVVGTQNVKRAELYGWGSSVGKHIDNTGFIYLVPLHLDFSVVYAEHLGEFREQRLEVGQVVRLWDYASHWTEDRGPVVAAFVGAFAEPCDAEAVEQLERGIAVLARGDYYGAPRVGPGYRVPLDDEGMATADYEGAELILIADAPARKMDLVPCAQCERPAHLLDHHWPYSWTNNACKTHRAERAAELGSRLAA